MNIVIILAGGVGHRVGADRPKQFIEILGKPILAYTTEIFQENEKTDAIEIVCHHSWMDYCRDMVKKYNLTKVRWMTEGGDTFQDSVMHGVRKLKDLMQTGEVKDTDNVYIQYGGAPFTSQKIVNAVIDMTEERGSAVTGTPCYQLMGTRDDESHSFHYVNRDEYIQIACPYGFRFDYLLDVYRRAKQEDLLDKIEPHTTSLMYALGDTINYAYGDQTNIKITTQEDLDIFEGYVRMKQARKESV